MKNLVYVFALIIISFLNIFPQSSEWLNYNTLNSGLPDSTVFSIAVDVSGNKWIGTLRGGLAEFDGTNWIVYDTSNSRLPDNAVHFVTIDKSGNKWIGTMRGGLAEFDGTNWTVYDTLNSGLPDNDVWAVTIDGNGNKWIGTHNGGLAEFDGTNWIVYNKLNSGIPDNDVRSIAIDRNGNKWIATLGGGFAKFDGTNWIVYNSYNSDLPYNHVMSVAIDINGNKWIGTFGGGVAEFDGKNWHVYNSANSGLPDNTVWPIAIDGNGNKWIGTYDTYDGSGLAKFDGTNWTVYDTLNSGLSDNSILAIAIDQKGNKWIGTKLRGLSEFKDVEALPVELTSFSVSTTGKNVFLKWETSTERNNYGFEVERSVNSNKPSKYKGNWDKIGFVKGNGNSVSVMKYSFIDKCVSPGKSYSYRLKQIDYEGTIKYSNVVNVEIGTPEEFSLKQNYPNPFNPTTTIEYSIPKESLVTLKIYDVLGKELEILIDKEESAGNYKVEFNAKKYSSGIYLYVLHAAEYIATKKLILIK